MLIQYKDILETIHLKRFEYIIDLRICVFSMACYASKENYNQTVTYWGIKSQSSVTNHNDLLLVLKT